MREFQEKYEFMLCAVNQVPPFDATLDWPKEIDGVKMEHYVAWMKSAYWITVTFRPAISVPAGFTPRGCRSASRSSAGIAPISNSCSFAHMFEQATHVGKRRPSIALMPEGQSRVVN